MPSIGALPLDHMPFSWPSLLLSPNTICLMGALLCRLLLPARWQQDNPATHSLLMGISVLLDSPSRLTYVLLRRGLLEMLLLPQKWFSRTNLRSSGRDPCNVVSHMLCQQSPCYLCTKVWPNSSNFPPLHSPSYKTQKAFLEGEQNVSLNEFLQYFLSTL